MQRGMEMILDDIKNIAACAMKTGARGQFVIKDKISGATLVWHQPVAQWGSNRHSGWGIQASQQHRPDRRCGAGFLAKPQVQVSDSNFHAKHPSGTPAGGWSLDSDPNKLQAVRLLVQAVREKLQAKSAPSPRATCASSYQHRSDWQMKHRANTMPDGEQTLT